MSKYDCELNLEDRNSLSVLLDRVKLNSTVLEFGPANGRMTKYMKEQLNCKVYAVEIDESAAKDAEYYTEKIIVDSIENYKWQKEFKDLKFDYIIFADVLEHLYYPEKVLKSVKEFLKEDGSILVSIPNIAHNSIIINLLKNEFNYNPTGLLDDTHIRFFTKKTFDQLIKKSGYFTSYETAIFINPQNTEFGNSYNEVLPVISEYLQSLPFGEIYQLIYEIKKNEVAITSDFSDEYKVYSKNFIQLFTEDGNGISEENSIKKEVVKHTESQKFVFDVSDRKDITLLRLDPLNDYCIIKINKILLNDFEIKTIQTNALHVDENIYYFNTNDSQIYIDVPDDIQTDKLIIDLEYLHIAEDALNQVSNVLSKTLETKEQNIQTLNEELTDKEQNIQTLNEELTDKEQNIQILNEELTDKEQNIQTLNEELVDIYISKSWKITRPLRNLMRTFKGETK